MKHCLLLSVSHEPLRIVSWQKAFILIFQNKVEILEEYSSHVSSASQRFQVPAVIKLKRWFFKVYTVPLVRFSRNNLYDRDNYTCQYCRVKLAESKLTMDHVVPVVRGGKKSWTNIVTACMVCNQKKGDKSLEESGMKLLSLPKAPKNISGIFQKTESSELPQLWSQYLGLQCSEVAKE